MNAEKEFLSSWLPYLKSIDDWQGLTKGITPKETNCGPVYEIDNPFDRPNESFAIADMRELDFATPHKHINGEVEIYYVLQGSGIVAVGENISKVESGSYVVIPIDTYHATLPINDLVLAVVNMPAFNAYNVVDADEEQIALSRTILQQYE
jgi:mannose-6-phosphate isomerase-like protein (cupin superfamily)